jgi:NADH-quinone oxidoreductase subunit A
MNTFFYDQYKIILVFLIISFAIASLLFIISYLFATQVGGSEKLSAYECGFEPFEDARVSLDIRFYLIGILFIIFDLEIIFLFPWSVSLGSSNSLGFWVMMDFLAELAVGYFYAWKKGSLNY